MTGKLLLLGLTALVISTYASTPQPVPMYTFACTGNAFERTGTCSNGGRPDSLLQGTDGIFYGTAQVSNEGTSTPTGGTIFSLTAAGTFTLLHRFSPGVNKNYPNGNLPGNLAEGSDGKLYGTTLYGGVGGCNGYCGSGVLYRINKDGTGFQILHRFCSVTNCTDGGEGAVVAAPDGNLYGASFSGGTGNCGIYYIGCGTIYKVTPSTGKYEVVVNFDQSTTGAFPTNLALASDGTFYGLNFGTTSNNLFQFIPTTATLKTNPVSFPFVNGLPARAGAVIQGPNGNFYGLYTVYGESGAGVYEVQPDGTNLQLFPFYTTVPGFPTGLIVASDGNFWMADYNGTSDYGDIIQLSPVDGSLMQRLSPFGVKAPAGAFTAMIIQAKSGLLWGTTGEYGKVASGQFGDGTVFKFNVGLPPR